MIKIKRLIIAFICLFTLLSAERINTLFNDDKNICIGSEYGLVIMDKATEVKHFYKRFNSGLPNDNVTAITRYRNSLWIGTNGGGIAEFDGENWTVYTSTNSNIPWGGISSLAVYKNMLWVGTSGGMASYDGSVWESYTTSNYKLPWDDINALTVDDTVLWIGSEGGGLFSYDGDSLEIYNYSNVLPSMYSWVNSLCYSDSILWAGTDGGLVKYDGRNWTRFDRYDWGLPNNRILSISADTSYVYFGVEREGLVKYNGSSWEYYDTANSNIPSNWIYALLKDDNLLWVGTESGLSTFDGGIWRSIDLSFTEYPADWYLYNTSNSDLPDNRIISLSASDTLLWIGTVSDGIASFNGETWQIYNKDNSLLPTNSITSVFVDDTTLWIGTSHMGLLSFNGRSWKLFNESNSIISEYINCITKQDSLLWVGTDYGLFSYNGNEWIEYNESNSGLPYNYITSIAASDSVIWMGTPDGRLSMFNGSTWESYFVNNAGSTNIYEEVRTIFIDNNMLWVGTSLGLTTFDGINWEIYNNYHNENCPLIYAFTNTILRENNYYWIATSYEGLTWYDKCEWVVYNTDNSILPSNNIKSLALFNNNIWIGTDDGLVSYNKFNVSIDDSADRIPSKFLLKQNYPNPFNPITTISYQLPENGDVNITIYDISGRMIRQWSYQNQSMGTYEIIWNGKDSSGNFVPSGVYIYRMIAGEFVQNKKMVLLK